MRWFALLGLVMMACGCAYMAREMGMDPPVDGAGDLAVGGRFLTEAGSLLPGVGGMIIGGIGTVMAWGSRMQRNDALSVAREIVDSIETARHGKSVDLGSVVQSAATRRFVEGRTGLKKGLPPGG